MDDDRFYLWSIGCLVFSKRITGHTCSFQSDAVRVKNWSTQWAPIHLALTVHYYSIASSSRFTTPSDFIRKTIEVLATTKKITIMGTLTLFPLNDRCRMLGSSWKQISAPKKIAHLLVATSFLRLCLRLFFAKDQMILHWIWADVSELIQSSAAKRHQDKNHGISILWQIQSEKSPIQICLHIHFHGFSTAK